MRREPDARAPSLWKRRRDRIRTSSPGHEWASRAAPCARERLGRSRTVRTGPKRFRQEKAPPPGVARGADRAQPLAGLAYAGSTFGCFAASADDPTVVSDFGGTAGHGLPTFPPEAAAFRPATTPVRAVAPSREEPFGTVRWSHAPLPCPFRSCPAPSSLHRIASKDVVAPQGRRRLRGGRGCGTSRQIGLPEKEPSPVGGVRPCRRGQGCCRQEGA